MCGSDNYSNDHIPRRGTSSKRGTGVGGGMSNEPSCLDISFQTQISSPKAEVVAELSVDDVLDIELIVGGKVTTVAVKHAGKIVGGLASPNISKIRQCLSQGIRYQATVISIDSGLIRIEVYAVQEE